MKGRTVITLITAIALVLVAVATTLAAPSERGLERRSPVAASHAPSSPGTDADEPEGDEEEAGTNAAQLDRLVERLAEAGVETDAGAIADLAATYGVGGAVRILAWADAAGLAPGEVAAMFDGGQGWGEIARQLNEADETLDLGPGIGWIMGHGGGHGRDNAPGQLKQP